MVWLMFLFPFWKERLQNELIKQNLVQTVILPPGFFMEKRRAHSG